MRPGTLEYAKYVIVFTTLEVESPAEVLECYRLRWQIELIFKRLKTLAQLGHSQARRQKRTRLALWQAAGRLTHAETDPAGTRYFPLGIPAPNGVVRSVVGVSLASPFTNFSTPYNPCCR